MKVIFYYLTTALVVAYLIAPTWVLAVTPAEAQANLEKAVRKLNVNAARRAIRDGAQVNLKIGDQSRPSNYTPYLHMVSSKAKNLKAAKNLAQLLLDNGAAIDEVDNIVHQTALHIATSKRNEPFAAFLIGKGAQVNAQINNNSSTPLHFAADALDLPTVKLLLSKGANPNIQKTLGTTSLHQALDFRDLATLYDQTTLDTALHIGNMLMAHGANPNVKNKAGESPLDKARKLKKYQPALNVLVKELEKPSITAIGALMGLRGLPTLPRELVKDIAQKADIVAKTA